MLWFDETLVVLTDKYRAGTHVLVLARDTTLATGPSALRARHAELRVERMAKAGRKIAAEKAVEANGANQCALRAGFHAKPSMPTLHILVSSDLRGSGMKTRRHWNTFATDFFREADDVVAALRARGRRWTGTRRGGSRGGDKRLRCHGCGDGPFAQMPKLFAHLDECERAR